MAWSTYAYKPRDARDIRLLALPPRRAPTCSAALTSIGVLRALGASRGHVTAVAALEALIVGAPAAAVGVLAGALVASGPSGYLLEILNELPPGGALVGPLVACLAGGGVDPGGPRPPGRPGG